MTVGLVKTLAIEGVDTSLSAASTTVPLGTAIPSPFPTGPQKWPPAFQAAIDEGEDELEFEFEVDWASKEEPERTCEYAAKCIVGVISRLGVPASDVEGDIDSPAESSESVR